MKLTVAERRFPLKHSFAISRGARTEAHVLVATIEIDGKTGRGECVPYARYGESVASVKQAILSLEPPFDRARLQTMLPPGAARNAVDCALWDVEAKLAGKPVWQLAGIEPPEAVTTAFTLSLDSPEAMRSRAEECADFPILKVKLGGGAADIERMTSVRAGAPHARLIVDANEGWNDSEYLDLIHAFSELGVEMVEQPFPAGEEQALADLPSPIALCADESCHGVDSFDRLPAGYSMINIKLDKTGGLTEALELRDRARSAGYSIMAGCMIGSSLAMAPAVLVGQGAEIVDLDGPLLLAGDDEAPLHYDKSLILPPQPALWG